MLLLGPLRDLQIGGPAQLLLNDQGLLDQLKWKIVKNGSQSFD